MVRPTLLLYFYFGLTGILASQNITYFQEGARWIYTAKESYEPGQIWINGYLEKCQIKGDTTIENVPYKKLYKNYLHTQTSMPPPPHSQTFSWYYENTGPFYLRPDVSQNKVFYRPHADSAEVVLYDFNLNAGDTVLTECKSGNAGVIKRVDTIAVFGNQLRFYNTDTFYIPFFNGVIEGVGGLNGLTDCFPETPVVSGGILQKNLLCFSLDDRLFLGPWANFQLLECPDDSLFLAHVKTTFEYDPGLRISPNPGYGDFKISVPEKYAGCEFGVIDQTGKILITETIFNSDFECRIDKPGLYFCLVKKGGNIYLKSKLIVLK